MIGLIFAGLGLLFGLGSAEVQSFERQAAADIKSRLQGERVEVQVHTRSVGLEGLDGRVKRVSILASHFSTEGLPLFTEPGLSRKGRIDDLRIDLDDFDLANLHVRQLRAVIPNCRYDFGLAVSKRKIRLSESGLGTGSVEIDEASLEQFILKKFHEIKRVAVHIAKGRLSVEGYGEFFIISTNFLVVARLQPVAGTKLVLADARISFDGKAADPISSKAILDTLNPVVDLNRDLKLYDAISVTSVDLEHGSLKATGFTKIPNDPATEGHGAG